MLTDDNITSVNIYRTNFTLFCFFLLSGHVQFTIRIMKHNAVILNMSIGVALIRPFVSCRLSIVWANGEKLSSISWCARGNVFSLFVIFAFSSIVFSLIDRIERTFAQTQQLFLLSKFKEKIFLKKLKRCGFIGWPIIISIHCNGRTISIVLCAHRKTNSIARTKPNVTREWLTHDTDNNIHARLQLLCGNSVFHFFSLSPSLLFLSSCVHLTMKIYFKDTFSCTFFHSLVFVPAQCASLPPQ